MYNPKDLVVPDNLMIKFHEEANDVAKEVIPMDVNTYLNDVAVFVKGYVASCVATFIRNKGIPSIPFPISLSTVDMICITRTGEGIKVLMGRKPKQEKWQFPGGFRDPKETSRQAAARELSEEACLFNIDPTHHCFHIKAGIQKAHARLESIGELFIDDIRYRDTPHKITTNIFMIELTEEEMALPKAGDDLGEVKWCSLQEMCIDPSFIRDIHLPIFDLLKSYLFAESEVPSWV